MPIDFSQEGGVMPGLKRSSINRIYGWSLWREIAEFHHEDPFEVDEIDIDLQGGDVKTYRFVGITPERAKEAPDETCGRASNDCL